MRTINVGGYEARPALSPREHLMRRRLLSGLTIDEINDIFGCSMIRHYDFDGGGFETEYHRGSGECLVISNFHEPEVFYA